MFRKLISLDEARRRIEKYLHPQPLGTVDVPLMDAVGRVLARDVISPINVPPFNRSTVDGYVVIAEDTFRADEDDPIRFKVIGIANVGEITRLIYCANFTCVWVYCSRDNFVLARQLRHCT